MKMCFGKMQRRLKDKNSHLPPLVTHLVLLVLQNLQVVLLISEILRKTTFDKAHFGEGAVY